MKAEDLFEAISELDECYRTEALQTVSRRRKLLSHRVVSAGLRAAVIVLLLGGMLYTGVKLHSIEQLLHSQNKQESDVTPEIQEITLPDTLTCERFPLYFSGAEDTQSAHIPVTNENLTGNNEICAADGGWYYLVTAEQSVRVCFTEEATGERRVLYETSEPVYDMTCYEGRIYLLQYTDGALHLVSILPDGTEWQQISLHRGEQPVACELLCHGRTAWVSIGEAHCALLYCCEMQTGALHKAMEHGFASGDVRKIMPHNLTATGRRVSFLHRSKSTNELDELWSFFALKPENADEPAGGAAYTTWGASNGRCQVGAFGVHTPVDSYAVGLELYYSRGTTMSPGGLFKEKNYPYLKSTDHMFLIDETVFFTQYYPYPDGKSSLWNSENTIETELPVCTTRSTATAAAAGADGRLYAVAYDTVYVAEWNAERGLVGEWKQAYSLLP